MHWLGGQKVNESQGHAVIKRAASVGMHVEMTARGFQLIYD